MPGAPPPSEPRAFPEAWDCLLSVHPIIHQSHACKFAAGLAARKKPLACFALQIGVFGSLLLALRSLALLARACAGQRCGDTSDTMYRVVSLYRCIACVSLHCCIEIDVSISCSVWTRGQLYLMYRAQIRKRYIVSLYRSFMISSTGGAWGKTIMNRALVWPSEALIDQLCYVEHPPGQVLTTRPGDTSIRYDV